MKYIKRLGLAAVAVASLMAFVGASAASATVLCRTAPNANGKCPAGWGYSGEIHAASEETPITTTTYKNFGLRECDNYGKHDRGYSCLDRNNQTVRLKL